MASIAPAWVTVNPSFMMPEILLPYSQASGAFDTLATGEPLVRLSDGDLAVYIKRIDIRTKMAAAQSAGNLLPSISTVLGMISTPTYLLRVRGEYDHHDTATMSRWGVSIVESQRLGMRQGTFQLMRSMLLFGLNPAYGEGLINTNGATSTPLPADSDGHTTVVTYDNGEMAFFLLSTISAIKSKTNQLGTPRRFTILGPQRDLSVWEYQGIVQLVQYQRVGAGSQSTAGVVKDVLEWNGDDIDWVYDDTLINKGAGTTDIILVVMPEVEPPHADKIDTNEFAKLTPGLRACTAMVCDMAAPREISVPLPGGAIDVVSELRTTPGWGIRPEAINILLMKYQ